MGERSTIGYRQALRHRVVRGLWLATAISTAGDYVASGALMILAYQRTGLVLGPAAIFAVQAVPALLSGALAGSWLDRVPRARALVGLQVVGAACVAIPLLVPATWSIFVGAALLGATRAAVVSVRSGAMADGVPDDLRGPLLGMIGTTETSGQVVGYLAGTTLAYTVGAESALLVDLVSFLIGAAVLTQVRIPIAHARAQRPPLTAGLRDILADPVLRLFGALVVVTATVGALPEALASAVAADRTGWGPIVFAAAPAGQAITMFFLGRTRQVGRPTVQLTHLALLSLAFGIATFGESAPAFALSNLLIGAGVAWTIGPQLTFVRLAPSERMAQVTGTMIAGLVTAEGLGTPVFAALADRTDVGTAYWVAGVLVLVAAVLGWIMMERTPDALALDEDLVTG